MEDLNLVGSCVSNIGRSVEPQELPCGLHNVLRLRGGGGGVRGVGSVILADDAVGSGAGGDQGSLDDGNSDAVGVASAGVFAKEEGFIDSGVGHAFPIFSEGYRLGPEFKIHLPSPPLATSGDVSFASSARGSGGVGGGRDGNRGRSAPSMMVPSVHQVATKLMQVA